MFRKKDKYPAAGSENSPDFYIPPVNDLYSSKLPVAVSDAASTETPSIDGKPIKKSFLSSNLTGIYMILQQVINLALSFLIVAILAIVAALDGAGEYEVTAWVSDFINGRGFFLVQSAVFIPMMFLLPLIYSKIRKQHNSKPLTNHISFSNCIRLMMIVLAVGFASNYISAFVELFFNMFGYGFAETALPALNEPTNFLLAVLVICIFPALFEEYTYRIVLVSETSYYGKITAVVFTSLMFSLSHMTFVQFIPTFFLGLAAAFVTVKYNSVYPAVIAHFINNFISVSVTALTDATGGEFFSGQTLSTTDWLLIVADIVVFAIIGIGIIILIVSSIKNKDIFNLYENGIYDQNGMPVSIRSKLRLKYIFSPAVIIFIIYALIMALSSLEVIK